MKSNTGLWGLVGAGVAGPLLVITVLLLGSVYEYNGEVQYPGPGTPLPFLARGTVVDQQFVAHDDDLSAVGLIFITSYGRSRTRLRFQLLDGDGQVLRARLLDSRQLVDSRYTDLAFTPIHAARGRTFHVLIEVLDTSPRAPLTLAATGELAPTQTQTLVAGGAPRSDRLYVRTYYGAPVPAWKALPWLEERAGQFKPPWLKVPWLEIWLVGAILCTLAALVAVARVLGRTAGPRAGAGPATSP
jgi:hypothetical protein